MQALGTNVVIKRDKATGSLVVPEENWDTPFTGCVDSVGSEVDIEILKGDRVRFPEFGYTELEGGFVVVREADLLVKNVL